MTSTDDTAKWTLEERLELKGILTEQKAILERLEKKVDQINGRTIRTWVRVRIHEAVVGAFVVVTTLVLALLRVLT